MCAKRAVFCRSGETHFSDNALEALFTLFKLVQGDDDKQSRLLSPLMRDALSEDSPVPMRIVRTA